AQADADAGRRRVDLLRRERIPNITLGAQYRHEEFSEVAAARLSVPLPIFRRNQGEIAEQQALVAQADTAVQQGKLKVALEVRASFAAWEQARSLLHDIPADLESRLGADAQALQDAYVRGTIPLPTALASLREVFNARRAVAEARAEATLAALDLLSASASSVAPAPPEEKP
ncbi:MAG TPA: TolC family protein, partial [Candidatus Sulfotelmatobacter sp.]|nr:TolC family protein [Candidatus Sulfotelmatobacter sp.]